MSLSRYFFHDFWTAREFNEMEDQMKARARAHRRKGRRAAQEREDLQADVGFLALTLQALIRRLVEKGVVDPDDLRAAMESLDLEDGVEDGRLDVDAARSSLGMPPRPDPEPEAPSPRRRRRRN